MFSFFQNQPDEIKMTIFRFLTYLEQIQVVPKVCKNWHSLSKKMARVLSDQEKIEISQKMFSSVNKLNDEIFERRVNGPSNPEPQHQKCIDEIKEFLAMGGDPNITNECISKVDKLSLLQGAALVDNLPLAEILIKKGAKVNYQDANGYTALHYAVGCGKASIARLLINNGADITITSKQGQSAADLGMVCEHWLLAKAIRDNKTKNWELLVAAEYQISDKEMARSSFGHGSNTAKKHNFR